MSRDELLAISQEANVAAFLRAIRLGEGTRDTNGYRRIVGGGLFDGWADHPRKKVWLPRYNVYSSAAGAYQFLARTWDELADKYQLPSFEPKWQDAGAVGLLIRRGALGAVRAGDIRMAIHLCREEWASLPGSPHGQRTEALDAVLAEYRRYGGELRADVPPPVAPAPAPPGEPSGPTIGARLRSLFDFLKGSSS